MNERDLLFSLFRRSLAGIVEEFKSVDESEDYNRGFRHAKAAAVREIERLLGALEGGD